MITQTIETLKKKLEKVCYTPHGIDGGVHMCGERPSGREENDSCILVSSFSNIDITGGLKIYRWVMIGAGCKIHTHSHPYKGKIPLLIQEENMKEEFVYKIKKEIHEDVWLFSSNILPQCSYIAKGVIVGNGSVVTKSIREEYSIWAGNPAKKIGNR